MLVFIAGRLGKDASIETTSGGTKMVKFSVVENEYKNGEETSVWYDVTSFSPFIMEKQINALKKGSFIVAPADLNVRPSFSKNGQLYLNYDAIVNSVKIINVNGRKNNNDSSDSTEENNDVSVTGIPRGETSDVKETSETKEKPKTKETRKEEKPEVNEPKPYVDDEDDGEELPF